MSLLLMNNREKIDFLISYYYNIYLLHHLFIEAMPKLLVILKISTHIIVLLDYLQAIDLLKLWVVMMRL